MYCEKCGKKLSENAVFCDECGAEIEFEVHNENKVKNVKIKRIIVLIILLLLLIAICSVGIFAWMSGRKDTDKPLPKNIEKTVVEVTDEKSNSFVLGNYITEVDSKLVMIDKAGIRVEETDTGDEKTVLEGDFDTIFLTDGEIVYFRDKADSSLKKVDLNTSSVELLTEVCTEELSNEYKDYPKTGNLLGYADECLFFREANGPEGMFTTFVYDLNEKTYTEFKSSVEHIGEFKTFEDKVYYNTVRFQIGPCDLYEANTDGSDEKKISDCVLNFDIVGDKLYYNEYVEKAAGGYFNIVVKEYDLREKTTNILNEFNCNGGMFFTDFCYAYGKTSDDDPYGVHIVKTNGETLDYAGELYGCEDDYLIYKPTWDGRIAAESEDFYVVTAEGVSECVKLPLYSYFSGYYDGKLYYVTYNTKTFNFDSLEYVVPEFSTK